MTAGVREREVGDDAARTLDPATPTTRTVRAVVAVYGAVVGLATFAVAHRALPDDAMITLAYARNLAERGEWALTPGLGANTATSPLNVVLEALLILVTGRPIVSLALLLAATTAVTAAWLVRIGGPWAGVLGITMVASNPLIASAVGLEVFMTVAVMVGLVRYALDVHGGALGGGVVGAAALTTRPDLAVVVLMVCALGAWFVSPRRGVTVLGLSTVLAAPWYLISWWRFGSAVPDTLAVKSDAGDSWGGYTFVDGVGHYLERWPLPTWLVLAGVAIGVVAVVGCLVTPALRGGLDGGPRAGLALALAGVAHYGGLALLGGAPFFWYYTPTVAGLGLCAVLVAVTLARRGRATAVLALTPVVLGIVLTVGYDVGRGVPWDGMAPIRINWATPQQYEDIAAGLPAGSTVESPGEIGYLAFHCRCRVVDYFADPGRMVPYVDRFRARHPSWVSDLNYANRRAAAPVPADYRLVYEFLPPDGPGQWPTSFPADGIKRMRLEPVR